MANDIRMRGPQDRGRINLRQPYEVYRWSRALGVTEHELRQAIAEVGNNVEKVKQHLRSARPTQHS